jgi:peptidoglycan hydrolase-like protein with peptidoglycan-binding domain
MKRTVSWITALAMILMLCMGVVTTYAATSVIYEGTGGTYSGSKQNESSVNPFLYGGNYVIYEQSDETKEDILHGHGHNFTSSLSTNSVNFTFPSTVPAGRYVVEKSWYDYVSSSTKYNRWYVTVYKHFNSNLISDVTATDVVYGSGEAPVVTATYDGTTALVQNTDFTVSYAVDNTVDNNTAEYSGWGAPTVPGSYVATLNAYGLYHDDGTGEPITVQFKVLPKDIDTLPDSDVYLKYFDDTYTGSEITPDVVVFDGAQKLVEGVDYTLTYTNNIAAGTYTASVNVNGIGNYTGTKVLNFSIVKPTVVHESYPTYVAAVAVPNSPMLKTGDNNNDVATLQTRLNELGYNCGEVDGVFGAKTRAAVIAFQKANNLSVDGVAGPQTWAALGTTSYVYYTPVVSTPVAATASVSTRSTLRRGNTGDKVKELQSILNALGYNCGEVDGVFGAKTEAGVRAYQTAMGLQADGVVGPLTWAKLG